MIRHQPLHLASREKAFSIHCNIEILQKIMLADIMHNILEGVGQYEVKLLFDYLLENFISKESFLNRMYF